MPTIYHRACFSMVGTLRFAHPTISAISGRSGARRLQGCIEERRSGRWFNRFCRGSIRAFHRGPVKLRLLRRSLRGFGRICKRRRGHLRIRGLRHVFIAQRLA